MNACSIRQMYQMVCDVSDASALHSEIHATLIVTNFDRFMYSSRSDQSFQPFNCLYMLPCGLLQPEDLTQDAFGCATFSTDMSLRMLFVRLAYKFIMHLSTSN